MPFDYAQTFYIDKNLVKGSPQVNISAVDLYFKAKPPIGDEKNPNSSGIKEPGVTLYFCSTFTDGTPNLTDVLETARVEYNEITASGDAASPTRFTFPTEVYCDTAKYYAIVTRFDGMEAFVLWTNKKGNPFVGTTTISPGVTDKNIGNLYTLTNRLLPNDDSATPGGQGSVAGGTNSTWIPSNDEDLKFSVYVARYANTNAITNSTYVIPTSTYEYVLFDHKRSNRIRGHKGERVFQYNPYYNANGVPLRVDVKKNNTTITAVNSSVNFTNIFQASSNSTQDQYIVVASEDDDAGHASGIPHKFAVLKIISVQNSSTIFVDSYPHFTNNNAKFLISPVAEIDIIDKSKSFDNWFWGPWWTDKTSDPKHWHFGRRKRQDLAVFRNSNANSSVRFVNGSIYAITINAGGTQYKNSDYIVITSTTTNSTAAYANLTTNSTGGIVNTFVTVGGWGHRDSPSFVVRANSIALSTGSGANLSFEGGPWILSERNKFKAVDNDVINFEIDAITPLYDINNPAGVQYTMKHQLVYYRTAGGEYVVNSNAPANRRLINNLKKNNLPYSNTPVLMSRSNEAVMTITDNTTIVVDGSSNNDFINPYPGEVVTLYHKNIINNDYTNEHTIYGNAASKHISGKVTFESGRLAEDLLVFVRAYRPTNTDFKVYAKLYNSTDPEAIDDKDWTLMQCISGKDEYSSKVDKNDVIEYIFNIPQYPNTFYTSAGKISMNSTGYVTGTGTNFTSETSGFKAGDVVKIYDALQPLENHMVTVVNSVVNSTLLTIVDPTSNSSLLGATMIDKIQYPYQAFRNITNDNVVRYYTTSSIHAIDGYDTFIIKTVLLADDTKLVPEIEDIRGIGVSA